MVFYPNFNIVDLYIGVRTDYFCKQTTSITYRIKEILFTNRVFELDYLRKLSLFTNFESLICLMNVKKKRGVYTKSDKIYPLPAIH